MPALNQNATQSNNVNTLNKQSLINLLIDSPLREAIKINLIDITNNTKEADLSKIIPTIKKEVEIYQKATQRRLKISQDILNKLSNQPTPQPTSTTSQPKTDQVQIKSTPTPQPSPTIDAKLQVPPLKLPPLPKPTTPPPQPAPSQPLTTPPPQPEAKPNLTKTPPPPVLNPSTPTSPTLEPSPKSSEQADEKALQEIQKELDALKNDAMIDASATPKSVVTPPTQDQDKV